MTGQDGTQRWKVGELAEATGLTVRTLHHWESRGLVSPSARTASGHRLYDEADVARVHRVVTLRELGLPLEAIGEVLDEREPDLAALLTAHAAQVRAQLTALGALERRLGALVAHVRRTGTASSSDLMALMDEVTTMDEKIRTYFDEGQLAQLARRREQLGDDHIASVENEWPELMAKVQAEMDAGTDPADPRVAPLAARWAELLEQFHGGDPGLRDSLYRMYEENSEEIRAQYSGPDPEMIGYISRAQAAQQG